MATENETQGETPAGEGTPAPEKPSYMTAAEFNKASTAREKKLLERIDKILEEKTAKQKAAEEVDDSDAGDESEDKGDAKDDKTAAKSPSDAMAKQLASLQRQLTRERNEREKERAEREAQSAKMARDEERTKLSEALAAAGVKNVRGAVALLHTEDKRVRRNDEGKIVFVDENDDEFDLAAGIKHWIGSEEGKAYMPPRGASGSGAEPGSKTVARPGAKQKLSKADAGKVLAGLLR